MRSHPDRSGKAHGVPSDAVRALSSVVRVQSGHCAQRRSSIENPGGYACDAIASAGWKSLEAKLPALCYVVPVTLDGFLTVLALLAAIYAVLSPVQRLRLTLSWRAQFMVAVPACIAVLAFELFDVEPPRCAAALGRVCGFITLGDADPGAPRKFAFLIALAWLVAFVVIQGRARLSLGGIPRFARLATVLLEAGQYDDATRLLEPHLPLLSAASRREARRQRTHDWLRRFGPVDRRSFEYYARPPGPQPFQGETWPLRAAKPVRALAVVVRSHAKEEHAASDLMQALLGSRLLLDFVVTRRPYFGLALAKQDAFGTADFFERYLGRLVADPGGALFQELSTNLTSDGPIGYALPAGNRLLHYLFADVRNAERLSAWKPVGDFVERLLAGAERPGYWSRLNAGAGWFEREQFSDPVYMAMLYFDIMVTSAARQGASSDMWLSYFSNFADGLEARYDSTGAGIDRNAEFPTLAARLLYELMTFLASWIGLYNRAPAESPLRRVPSRHDQGGGIPQSAAISAGHALAVVVNSARVDDGVVRLLHTVAMRALLGLRNDDGARPMRRFLIDAILDGGYGPPPPGHFLRLRERFEELDHFDQHALDDYRKAIGERMDGGSDGRRFPKSTTP